MTKEQCTSFLLLEPCNTGASKFEIQGGGKKVAVVEDLQHAQRIVACWNAFDGCDIKLIEAVPALGTATLPYRLMQVSHADLLTAANAARDALTDERADADFKAMAAGLLIEAIKKAGALAAVHGGQAAGQDGAV